jgi:predicted metal-dependent hydrolase
VLFRSLTEYLNSNSKWILRNLDKYCHEVPASPLKSIQPANTISYLGKCITITQKRNDAELTALKLEQNVLVVNLDPSAGNISSEDLEQWLKSQANQVINVKVRKFSSQMGLDFNRVVIRDQKSRWGSCSCLKNLNFNWRLIMAPEPVLDYVIIHELCHLREMSHSKSFWKLVAQYCPQWQELRNWLDNHCVELNASLQI